MPIYEYQCKDCDEISEVMQKFSDPLLASCPACGAEKPTRLISRSSFHLKGTGWYKTDYKKTGSDSSTKSDKAESGKKEPKKEKKKTDSAAGSGKSS